MRPVSRCRDRPPARRGSTGFAPPARRFPAIPAREIFMLDAHSPADASARPQLPPDPATASVSVRPAPSASDALFAAARTLLPVLEAGRPLDAGTLRDAMTRAFGATDAEGAWLWKDAYEAAEAAAVLVRAALRARQCASRPGPARTAPATCWQCWTPSRRSSRRTRSAPRSRSACSSSRRCRRWPMPRSAPPPSGRAIPCWSRAPAPACWR